MAFGDVYGYRTNVTTVVAFAEGDEYDADGTAATTGDRFVDLVLTGFASGTARRQRVPVADSSAAATKNQAFAA